MNKISSIRTINFGNGVQNNKQPETQKYEDPLMKWPLRGAAFTNEVGEALRPVIGHTAATCSWIPALLYFGADIYDKYKNNNTQYDPNKGRSVEQAIFQGLASVCFPLCAVKTGQYIFSQFGKLAKDKISYNSQQYISGFANRFIDDGKMRAFDGKDEECVKEFIDKVVNNHDVKKTKKFRVKNFDKIGKMEQYAEKTIRDLMQLRKDLLNSSADNMKTKWFLTYKKALDSGQTSNVAIKTTLKEFQYKKNLHGNTIKTIGGFVALGLMIKPIDYFVEEIILKKYINPVIEKTTNNKK